MEARGLNEELRNVYPSAFRAHSSRSAAETPVFSTAERPTSTSAESLTPYVSFPANIGTSSSVTFGCRLVSCYGCKVSQNAVFPSSVVKQNANGQSASKPVDYGWLKEVAFYQSYTGSYPVYFDLPVVHKTMAGDSRHETCLTMEDHPPWKWSNNCSSQLYCSKDQTQSQHFWKPSLTEGTGGSFCPRGRKKRVPYTKLQLKELEREYTTTTFITKEKRRLIAFYTNLSERQVIIGFQNRRINDKKRPNICI
ncbi:LOW QUALITY PROTEIN: homeobox protein Hox-D13a [Carassius auratus]|uniref:LOW QUALITY PROTEIN: homeobox protein Hox-D13a n=1 Tax=Carassius auratus TaxID=7957 RepID=A0A6P6Q4R3_CARAU|nr:LOW QUALITY PROTEIN: homeobox protein Hox-D13a-like [Carassius auratus]